VAPYNYIAVGTSEGYVILFNYELTEMQKIGTEKEKKHGGIVAIDIAYQDNVLLAVHKDGSMMIWSLEKNKRIKKIKPPEKSPVLCVKFIMDRMRSFLVSTGKGSVYLYKVEQTFLKLKSEKTLLMTGEKIPHNIQGRAFPEGIFSIKILPKDFEHQSGSYTVVAVASMKKVVVFTLEPVFKVIYVDDRSENISIAAVPSISWGFGSLPGKRPIEGEVRLILNR